MVKLQQVNKKQMIKLLDAINREGIDNQFWFIDSYENSWSAGEVFSAENNTIFEPGDYIVVMYDEENQFPTFPENHDIVTSFPHYDYWIEEDLRALIFKI